MIYLGFSHLINMFDSIFFMNNMQVKTSDLTMMFSCMQHAIFTLLLVSKQPYTTIDFA
jgi:predicted neutral ceramidase superfamily lipid hydrolase